MHKLINCHLIIIYVLILIGNQNLQPQRIEYFHGKIILDHRRFNLNQVNRTIAWNLENNQSCTSSLMFVVKSSRCATNSLVKNWTTHDLELTLPVSALVVDDELLCFSIETADTSNSNCSGKSLPFILSPNGMHIIRTLSLFCLLYIS